MKNILVVEISNLSLDNICNEAFFSLKNNRKNIETQYILETTHIQIYTKSILNGCKCKKNVVQTVQNIYFKVPVFLSIADIRKSFYL